MGNYKDIRDIYDVLDSLRKRPGLYLEYNTGSQFSNLITFVNALGFSSFEEGSPSFWEFSRWMTGRVDGMSKTLPWAWMQSEWGNDKAFEMFFELLDEYRTCTHVYLCRGIIREHKPNFYRVNSSGDRIQPEKPLEVCAAQFAPSSVYYLLEVYTLTGSAVAHGGDPQDRAASLIGTISLFLTINLLMKSKKKL